MLSKSILLTTTLRVVLQIHNKILPRLERSFFLTEISLKKTMQKEFKIFLNIHTLSLA